MKKKMLAVVLAVLIGITGIFSEGASVRAEDEGEDIDYSYYYLFFVYNKIAQELHISCKNYMFCR